MCKNDRAFQEYRQHRRKRSILDIYGNYFLFDFYCSADGNSIRHFLLWQCIKLQCRAIKEEVRVRRGERMQD